MHFSSLLAAGACASQAAAFLVPLEVAKAVKTVQEDLHLSLVDQKSSSVNLECDNCYFDTEADHQDDYAANSENTLALNFTVDDQDNTLSLNGRKFYPLEFPATLDLYAPLVRSANGVASGPIHLGYALEYLPFQDTPEGIVAPIRLTIIDLDGIQVKIPSVELKVVKLPTRELLIAKVETIPADEVPGSECQTSFCRVREMAMARLREMIEAARAGAHKTGKKLGLKGCSGHRKAGHHAPGKQGFEHGRLPGHRRPHRFQDHHRHHHHHGLRKFVHQAMHLFVIPALLGIIGGLTASAIGMFVGQLIVFVWFRFVRGGHRGRASSRSEVAVEEEKEALVGEEDAALPPAYTDSEAVVAADEKN